jgi:diguanylate cyclase (GGDEF)-like protein/PAS domain S-box-containing protein
LSFYLGRIWWQRQFEKPVFSLVNQGEMALQNDLAWKGGTDSVLPPLDELARVMAGMTVKARQMIDQALGSQEKFQRLFLDSRDAAFIINSQGRIEELNPAGVSIFGFEDKSELLALKDTAGLFASAKDRKAYLEALNEKGYVQDLPIRLKRKNGEVFDALITATAGANGESRVGLVRDVTLRKRANEALKHSEERYRRLLANAPDMICRWSVKRGGFDYVSEAALTVLGYAPEDIIASPGLLRKCLHPDWREKVVDRWKKVLSGPLHTTHTQEYQVIHKSGEVRWVSERTALLPDEHGDRDLMEGLLTDVTVQKQFEAALIEGNAMVEKTLAGLPVPVMVIDREHKVVHWNRAMASLTNIEAEEVVGTSRHWQPFYGEKRPVLADLIMEKDWEGIKKYYGEMNLKHSDVTAGGVSCEGFFPDMGGQDRHLYFLAAPIEDKQGTIVRAVETVVDISDRKRLEDELLHLSITDDLTGLFNQRFFFATLNREVESAVRYGQSLALILLDLDFFKQFNDNFGHLEGDKALQKVGSVLQNMIRTTDLACRYGGEEFVILLPRAGYEQSYAVAERVRKGISELVFKSKNSPLIESAKLTASFGIALFKDNMTGRQLLQLADQAMYQAKKRGRNRVFFWGVGDMPTLPLDKENQ